MFSFSDTEKEKVHQAISEYNNGRPIEEQVKFIHGSSSAIFEFMGRQVTVNHPKRTESKVTPKALIPTGMLRRNYGIYPISGELAGGVFGDGVRRKGINYAHLSGMAPDKRGVSITTQYARDGKRFETAKVYKNIEDIIRQINHIYYARSLKMLVMYFTILKQMDPNAIAKLNLYLQLLRNEQTNLKLRAPENDKAQQSFNKYISRLEKIASGHMIPFEVNDSTRSNIINQFPIILCATANSAKESHGSGLNEKIVEGELPMSDVKIIFTPNEYVERLRQTLNNLGLDHINVKGYTLTQQVVVQNKNEVDFLASNSQADLKHCCTPEILSNSDLLTKKLDRCLVDYVQGHGQGKLEMVKWLLKNIDDNCIRDIYIFGIYVSMMIDLEPKVKADPNYLKNLAPILGQPEYERIQRLLELEELLTFRKQNNPCGVVFDYSRTISSEDLSDMTTSGWNSNELKNLILLNNIFQEDLRDNPGNNNIIQRIEAVKGAYLRALKNLILTTPERTGDRLTKDELQYIKNPLFYAISVEAIKQDEFLRRFSELQSELSNPGILSSHPATLFSQAESANKEKPQVDQHLVNRKGAGD